MELGFCIEMLMSSMFYAKVCSCLEDENEYRAYFFVLLQWIYSRLNNFYGVHQFASLVCNPLLLSVGFKILCSLESDYKSDSAHPLRLVYLRIAAMRCSIAYIHEGIGEIHFGVVGYSVKILFFKATQVAWQYPIAEVRVPTNLN